jgi:Calx-beta domain
MEAYNSVLAPFTAGDLVVYRVGNGTGNLANASSPVFLDEYTPTGTLVQSIALPTTISGTNKPLTATGTNNIEGLITLSADGRYLLLTGYASNLGVAFPSSSTSANVNRTVGRVDNSGNVDTSTALTDFSSQNYPVSAISTNGTDIWVAGAGISSGSGGVRYTTLGSTISTQISNTATSIRQINIFDGQLYASTSQGTTFRLGTVGSDTPTISGQTISGLPGVSLNVSPYGFFFADLTPTVAGVDTLYVTDGVNSTISGGLTKYSLVSGSWVNNGRVGSGFDDYRGVTGSVTGTTVNLFATRYTGSTSLGGGELIKLTDTSGYNGTLTGAPTILATATTYTAFRGVAFAPTAPNPTVNLSVSSISSSETSPAAITITATASSAVVGNQTVNLAVGGTGITTSDYTLSGTTTPNVITILSGQTTGTATFTVVDDTLVEGTETATLTISNPSTGITLGSTTTQNISIADNDVLPTVTLSTQTPNITEGGNIPGVFHFARTGATTSPLTVNYTVGTNTTSADYNETLGGIVTIAAGQSVADITVTLVDDQLVEGIEYIELYLPTDPNYTVVPGTNSNDAVITIADNDVLPTVTIAAQDANAAEAGNDPGVFRISRTGATTSALTVNYQVSGNTLTTDYTETLGGTVTIAANQAYADITITPVDDPLVEGSEYIDLFLPSNANYSVGTPGNNSSYAEVTIADNDTPTVSIVAQDANAAEAGSDPGVFRISRTGDTTSTLQVYFDVNGTVNGNDYTPGIYVPSVVIAAGESFADITINPVDDLLVEGPETVDLTLTSNAKYILGTSINAVVTIADNDVLPTVTITAQDANAAEAGNDPGVFRISRTGATTSALIVNYQVSGNASATDYTETLGGTVTIAAGQTFADITITPVDDPLVEGSETVNLTLTANAAVYTLGTTAATVSIADNDASIAATRNDFNHDSKSDILWRDNLGSVGIWQMDGNNITNAPQYVNTVSLDWKIAAPIL